VIYTVTLNPTLDRTMHFPELTVGTLNRARHSRTDYSGKGINVSVALRELEVPSVAMGLIAGVYGQVMLAGVRAWGLECSFLEVPGETRSNITVIDEARGVTTKLNEPGPTASDETIAAFEALLSARLQEGDGCVFSGSLPPGAPDDTYARLVRAAHQRGAWATLDTSGPAFRIGCLAAPEWVKPNQIEASELTGLPFDNDEQIAAGLRAVLALGPGRVLLSLGDRGAAYAEASPGGLAIWRATPPTIREISAVGAGDALHTGGLWAWMRGLPADEVLRWATASGTAAAMLDGSQMPSFEQIKAVYARVWVTRLV
jgi:1-phosphofructokinase family hexose kinase